MISRRDYFGMLDGHRLITPAIRSSANDLLLRVNAMLDVAAADDIDVPINPATKTQISGQGSGGWRLPQSIVGSPFSAHKTGQAVDIYDPSGDLDEWCLDHLDLLEKHGLYLEHPAATKGWCHLSTRAPRSGKRVFYP